MPIGESLRELLERSVDLGEDRVALIDARPSGTREISYLSLRQSATAGAAHLAAAGVSHGDVVGLWLPNSTEAVAMQFAAASLGAVVVGMNTRYRIEEVAHVLVRTRPRCIVLPERLLNIDFRGLLSAALGQVASTDEALAPPAILVAGERVQNVSDYDLGGGATSLDLSSDGAEALSSGRASDLVNMFSTSGSTGLPKFAAHDQAAVARHARNVSRHLDVGSGDVLLCALPVCGVFGFNFLMAGIAAGASCLLVPTFEGRAALRLMSERAVTHTCGGDDLYVRLIDASSGNGTAPNRWRRGAIADFTGKAAEVVAWAEAQFGARLGGVYGSSECFAFTAVRDPGSEMSERVRPGGDVVDDEIEVRSVDPESGAALASDEVGEIQVRGYNVMREYYADPLATARSLTEDGWLRTGDLGSVAASGSRFTFQCRAGDALRLHGFLVEPAEIEAFLMRHPAVDGAHVVGVPGTDGAEEAVAFVTVRSPVAEEELLESCRRFLARYKVPKRIVRLEEFPVTAGTNGSKIRRGELRKLAAGLLTVDL